MKRVIKFLFPKTCQLIYNEGYAQCLFDVNDIYDNPEYYAELVEEEYNFKRGN